MRCSSTERPTKPSSAGLAAARGRCRPPPDARRSACRAGRAARRRAPGRGRSTAARRTAGRPRAPRRPGRRAPARSCAGAAPLRRAGRPRAAGPTARPPRAGSIAGSASAGQRRGAPGGAQAVALERRPSGSRLRSRRRRSRRAARRGRRPARRRRAARAAPTRSRRRRSRARGAARRPASRSPRAQGSACRRNRVLRRLAKASRSSCSGQSIAAISARGTHWRRRASSTTSWVRRSRGSAVRTPPDSTVGEPNRCRRTPARAWGGKYRRAVPRNAGGTPARAQCARPPSPTRSEEPSHVTSRQHPADHRQHPAGAPQPARARRRRGLRQARIVQPARLGQGPDGPAPSSRTPSGAACCARGRR